MIDSFITTRLRRHPLVVALVVLALVIAGCGGGDDTDEDDPTGADTTTTTTAPATTEAASPTTTVPSDEGDVVDDPPALTGTEWEVHTLHSAEYGMTNVWPDTEVSLAFGADGTVSGFSGCNDFTGSYELIGDYLERDPINDVPEGQQIVIADLPDPVGGCDANADEQEGDLFTALETAEVWQIDDAGELTLIGPQGLHIGADPTG